MVLMSPLTVGQIEARYMCDTNTFVFGISIISIIKIIIVVDKNTWILSVPDKLDLFDTYLDWYDAYF